MKKITISVIVIVIVVVANAMPATQALPAAAGAPAGAPVVGPLAAVALLLSLGGDSPQPCVQGGCIQVTPTSMPRMAIVIDDDPSWSRILNFRLQELGFEVITCITFCDDFRASLIFVDGQIEVGLEDVIVGPGMVSQLRLNHPRGQAVIVGFTGRPDFLDATSGRTLEALFLQAGADLVWNKGISWEKFLPNLRSLLGL